jgi:lipopolysaccharide transport system permease protein
MRMLEFPPAEDRASLARPCRAPLAYGAVKNRCRKNERGHFDEKRTGADRPMRAELAELCRYRELLVMLALRDIKIRYKQSVMGFFWAILMPALIVCAGIMVRYAYAVVSHKPLNIVDFTSLAIKSVVWAFLVSSIRFSCQSLLNNNNLVTKVYFPKEVLPIAAVLSQLFDLLIASSLLVVLMLVVHLHPTWQLLWAGPLLLVAITLVVGGGLLVAAGALFFRDVKYLVEVFLTFAIFFTPVFYDVSMFGPHGHWLLLNPVAPLMEGLSAIVRGSPPNWHWVSYSFSFAAAMTVAGYLLFKRSEPVFAESI